jgi:hypothetical protein
MLLSLPGIYREGAIELSEPPVGISNSDVIVTFLAPRSTEDEQAIRGRFIARLKRGFDFVGPIPNRTELYAERTSRAQLQSA